MKNPYDILWADALCRIRRHYPKEDAWLEKNFLFLTLFNSINLGMIMVWCKILDLWFPPFIEIDFLKGTLVNKSLWFIVNFYLPFAIINFLLYLRGKRYEKVMKKYGEGKRNYTFIYGMFSAFSSFITIMIYGFLTDFGDKSLPH